MDGLMGNRWADACINGWTDGWAELIIHFGLQRSHVYPSLTIPWFKHIFARTWNYRWISFTEGAHTEISKKQDPLVEVYSVLCA